METEYLTAEYIMPEFLIPYNLKINFCGMCIDIIRFTKMAPERPWMINAHAHENFEFHYIISGKGTVIIENNTVEIQEGDFYITAPFVKHEQKANPTDPMKEFCIECKLKFDKKEGGLESEIQKYETISKIIGYKNYKDTRNIADCFWQIEEVAKENSFGMYTKIQLLCTQIITDCFGIVYADYSSLPHSIQQDIKKQRTTAIKNYIDANISKNITLKDVAKKFYFSEKQANRIIMAEFNCSFYQYVMKLRSEVAVRLLKNTALTIEQVAIESGFGSYRQMLRVFERYHIDKPSKIRSEAKMESIQGIRENV